jgi:hypothetical protein
LFSGLGTGLATGVAGMETMHHLHKKTQGRAEESHAGQIYRLGTNPEVGEGIGQYPAGNTPAQSGSVTSLSPIPGNSPSPTPGNTDSRQQPAYPPSSYQPGRPPVPPNPLVTAPTGQMLPSHTDGQGTSAQPPATDPNEAANSRELGQKKK